MEQYTIGIDIGGTSIKIGIISQDGVIHDKWEIATNTGDGGKFIVSDIWSSVEEKLQLNKIEKHSVLGIGIGAPGFINTTTGVVHEAVNIGWKDFQLASQFKKLADLPVYAANDANVAALGENWKGAGKQANNLIAVTLGTGVGGGIIANGQILSGENGTAGEIGHITVDPNGYRCNCGRKGCLETITSATGMVRQAMEQMKENPHSDLATHYDQSGQITAKDIFDLAKKGDVLCNQIINHTADILGSVIANIAAITNPAKVLIGGGVSQAGDQLIPLINKYFHEYALGRLSDVCEMKATELGNDAGMIGAAFLVKQNVAK